MTTPSTRTTAIALLALGITGCDLFGPDVGPPAELDPSTLPTNLVAGQNVAVSVTITDARDRTVSGQSVSWTPSGNGSVPAASSSTDDDGSASTEWTLDTVAGPQTLTASAGGVETTFTADVGPDVLATLTMAPTDTTLEAVGDTLVIAAPGLDRYGNDVDTPGLVWASSDPDVASVSAGIVVSHAEGVARITATSDGVSAEATVTVDQVVTTLSVDPASPVMVVEETLQAAAQPVDARGSTVDTTLAVSWTSSDDAVATVSGDGVVTAEGTGIATITAAAGTFVGEAAVDVRTGPRPTITGISPAVLGAGDTATITGTDFPADPGQVDVYVGGLATSMLAASDAELTVEMPAPGTFPCEPTGDRDVVVDVDGLEATESHPVAGAPRHSLSVGGSVAFLDDDVACNEITEPGTYVISVFNTSSNLATTSFRLQGTASSAVLAADGAPTRSRLQLSADRPTAEADPELEGHFRVIEENRRLVEELGGPTPLTDPDRPRLAAQEVDDIRTFRVPDLDQDNFCQDFIEVDARAAYVGTHGVVWEDTMASLAGEMDEDWAAIGAEYDDVMHQILLDYFGDPLVYDDRLDDNGLFFMLFSEAINDYESIAVSGFVFAGDFYTRNECDSSDGAEIFYGRVPTVPGYDYDSGDIADWAWRMRSTVIHEVKHLTAYANKFDADAATFEELGLEEATARLAEEFFARTLQGYTQFGNVGYDESIYCERRPGQSGCPDDLPVVMHKHYNGVNSYLKEPALLSPFGRVRSGDNSFYGSGWQWVRWVIDQSGVPEADFIKPLIREPDLYGPDNVADKAGRTVAELLADYTLAFAVDDHPSGMTPTRPELTIPSWDTRDIFQGLHDDYAGEPLQDVFPTPWPLEPSELSGGGFQVDVPMIRHGGAVIFELSGMTGGQLLELLSESGGSASPILGLSLVRIE